MVTLDTPRLHLRPYVATDLDALHALTADPAMREYLGNDPPSLKASHDRLLRSAGGWALYGFGILATIERDTGIFVGNVGLFPTHRDLGPDFDGHAEAGWIIAAERWGRGYASEAMEAVLNWFDQNNPDRRVVCMIVPGHGASERIAARLGFRAFRDAEDGGDPVTLYERV